MLTGFFLCIRWLWPVIIKQTNPYLTSVTYNSILGFSHIPGSENGTIDKNGFRNTDIKDSYPIITLGNSHTENYPTKSWPAYIQDTTGLAVYNMGVGGYSIAQYSYLMDQALTFHPKMIIVGVNVSGDILDAYNIVYHNEMWKDYRSPTFIDDRPAYSSAIATIKFKLKSPFDFLRAHSKIYVAVGDGIRAIRKYFTYEPPSIIVTSDWDTNNPDATLEYNTIPAQKTLFGASGQLNAVNLRNKNVAEGLRLSKLMINEMAQKAKADDTILVIVLIPPKETAYAPLISVARLNNATYNQVLTNETAISHDILSNCTQHNILCYNLTDFMQTQMKAGKIIYYPDGNQHPAEFGYRVYADGIINYLKAHGLL